MPGWGRAGSICVCALMHLSIVWSCVVRIPAPLCSFGVGRKNAVGLGLGTKLCPCTVLLKILSGLFLSHPPFGIGGKQTPLSLLLLLGSQLCLGVMLQTPGSVSVCVTSPQLSDEPLGASPWARQCPLRWVAVLCQLQCCGAFHKMAVAPWLCCDKSCVSASEEPALLLGGALERRALG